MEEKVIYGLSNLHLAPVAEGHTKEEPKYQKPFPNPGATGFSPEAEQEIGKFFADDRVFFTTNQTSSYTGDLITAKFIDKVQTEILGNIILANGGLLVVDGAPTKEFAIMAESKTDIGRIRYVYYLATGGNPTREYATLEDGAPEIPTETMNVSMSSIKLKYKDAVSNEGEYIFMYKVREGEEGFDTFFNEVPLPEIPKPATPPQELTV